MTERQMKVFLPWEHRKQRTAGVHTPAELGDGVTLFWINFPQMRPTKALFLISKMWIIRVVPDVRVAATWF